MNPESDEVAAVQRPAAAGEAMRWIALDERLPPRATPVLALVGATGKKRPQRCAVLEYWTPGEDHSDDEPGWFEAGEPFASDFVWPVTHWMPLPPAPNASAQPAARHDDQSGAAQEAPLPPPPTGPSADRAATNAINLAKLRRVMADWHATAVKLGYDGVSDVLGSASSWPEQRANDSRVPPATDEHVAVGCERFSDGHIQTEESLRAAQLRSMLLATCDSASELPPLPEPSPIPGFYEIEARKACVYTADQMRAYARAAMKGKD